MTKQDFINVLSAILEQEKADGCHGCAFIDKETFEMPCKECKRNCKDYWRQKYAKN